jgi:hypothetical protein
MYTSIERSHFIVEFQKTKAGSFRRRVSCCASRKGPSAWQIILLKCSSYIRSLSGKWKWDGQRANSLSRPIIDPPQSQSSLSNAGVVYLFR